MTRLPGSRIIDSPGALADENQEDPNVLVSALELVCGTHLYLLTLRIVVVGGVLRTCTQCPTGYLRSLRFNLLVDLSPNPNSSMTRSLTRT